MSSLISFHELVLYLTLKNICQMYIKAKVATPNFFLLNVRRFLFHVISNTISFAQNRSERFLFLAFCHKNWQSLRYLCLRKYVICSCIQRNTTEKIVTVCAHERLPIDLANRRANLSYSSPVCNITKFIIFILAHVSSSLQDQKRKIIFLRCKWGFFKG